MNITPDNQPQMPSAESAENSSNQTLLNEIVGQSTASPAIPPLARDPSFWGMTVTQFLGGFNDNVFKQLLMLMAIPVASAADVSQASGGDDQGKAMLVFSLPFLIFSGYAGFLSDRYSKRLIVVSAKLAEILVMLLGVVAFFWLNSFGYAGLLCVLFLMGTHSAFFGPAKYGILPEMLHQSDLPRANGIFLMTTFLAVIFGQVTAGFLKMHLGNALWMASLVCVGIAVVGTMTSLLVRSGPPAQPRLRLTPGSFFITKDIFAALCADRSLVVALLVSSTFWMIAGIVNPAVNSLGIKQLHVDDVRTSIMLGSVGIGIMFGCVLAGYLSRGKVSFRILNIGAWGLVATLLLLTPWKNGGEHLLGYHLCLPVLVLLGLFAGFYAVPVQVFLQSRPTSEQKGRMIAAMNQANWIGIVISALIYMAMDQFVEKMKLPRSTLFGLTALMMLPIALFYRPENEVLATHEVSTKGG